MTSNQIAQYKTWFVFYYLSITYTEGEEEKDEGTQ